MVVINAEKVHLTGEKVDRQALPRPLAVPRRPADQERQQLIDRHPTDLVKRAVWGMLPKGPLGRRIYKKLKVYAGAEHPHAAQQPKPLAL